MISDLRAVDGGLDGDDHGDTPVHQIYIVAWWLVIGDSGGLMFLVAGGGAPWCNVPPVLHGGVGAGAGAGGGRDTRQLPRHSSTFQVTQ